jgi:RNase P protein component
LDTSAIVIIVVGGVDRISASCKKYHLAQKIPKKKKKKKEENPSS